MVKSNIEIAKNSLDDVTKALESSGLNYEIVKESDEKINLRIISEKIETTDLFEKHTDIVAIIDQKGFIKVSNPAFKKATGIENDKLNNILRYIHPDDKQLLRTYIDKIKTSEKVLSLERRLKTVTGWRWYLWTVIAQKSNNNKIKHITLSGRDIHARIQMQKELKGTKERFKGLTDSMSEGVVIVEPDLKISYVNKRTTEISGYNELELLNKDIRSFFDSENLQKFYVEYQKGLKGVFDKYTISFLGKDGAQDVPIVVSPRIIFNSKGDVKYIYAVFYSLSDIEKSDKKLTTQESKYQRLFSTISEGIVFTDLNGIIDDVNPAFEQLSGFSKEELKGKVIEGWANNEKAEIILKILGEGYSGEYEEEFKKKDGSSITVRVKAWLLKDGDVPWQIIWNIEDYTMRKRFDRQQQKMNEQLRLSQRLATIGSLSAGITHEINQPLNALKIIVDGMLYWKNQKKDIPLEEMYENLELISIQGERINEIVKHMRRLIKEDRTSRKQEININQSVERAVALIRQQLNNHNIRLELSLSDNVKPVIGFQTQLEQAIINLVNNSRDAHDEIDKKGKYITISTYSDEISSYIIVQDNAKGINEEDLNKVFDPFFTTKLKNKAMGFGLSVTENIVSDISGSVKVKNNSDGGATFTIEIPFTKE